MDKEDIIGIMRMLTDEERYEIIHSFCVHCGNVDPRCQCWNDE